MALPFDKSSTEVIYLRDENGDKLFVSGTTKPILEMSQVFQQSTPIFEGPSDGMRLLKEHTKVLQDRVEVKQLK